MKQITELLNKHIGPIWIVGSDPTLEEYPDNFLDNKIGITLHLAYLKFPNATYRYFNEYDRITYLISKDSLILEKPIVVGYPFYHRSVFESDRVLDNFKTVWYLDNQDYPPNGDPADIFTDIGVNAMKKWVYDAREGKSNTYGSNGTCMHNAMFVALMMGGNPINVIGCNFSTIDGKEHFGEMNEVDHQMRAGTAPFTGYRGDRMIRGYNAIVEACNELKIKVNRYARFADCH